MQQNFIRFLFCFIRIANRCGLICEPVCDLLAQPVVSHSPSFRIHLSVFNIVCTFPLFNNVLEEHRRKKNPINFECNLCHKTLSSSSSFVYFVDAWIIWFGNFFFQTLFFLFVGNFFFFRVNLFFMHLVHCASWTMFRFRWNLYESRWISKFLSWRYRTTLKWKCRLQHIFHVERNENNFNAESERRKKRIFFNVRPILIK